MLLLMDAALLVAVTLVVLPDEELDRSDEGSGGSTIKGFEVNTAFFVAPAEILRV